MAACSVRDARRDFSSLVNRAIEPDIVFLSQTKFPSQFF
jgi:antitoxin (DNA-binding transcriptional repressor) of toxin-antitoxin stability system